MNPWSYKSIIANLSSLTDENNTVAQSTIETLQKAQSLGVKCAIITEKSFEDSRNTLEELGITGPSIFLNGAVIRTVPNGDIVAEHIIAANVVDEIKTTLNELLGDEYHIDTSSADSESDAVHYISVYVNRALAEEVGEALLLIEGVYYTIDETAGHEAQSKLTILSSDADKGLATQQLLSLLDVELEDAACIGADPTDILMFNECGLNVALESSDDDLKLRADHVVTASYADGFNEAVEFILAS
jgi:hydroxymethylpyrimidine pyrophosphatase-like HAD family hydrolase